MLQTLKISNFALIQEQTLSFDKGLNIISGETGSGKSMVLDALAIVFGNRWHPKLFYYPSKKCVLEARYLLKNEELKPFFDNNDLDFDFEVIVRREALPSGKNRMFINDTPVKVNTLKQLGNQLLSVHSQHQNLDLSNNQFQLSLLDAFILDEDEKAFSKNISAYKTFYLNYIEEKSNLSDLEEQQKTQQLEKDYQQFLLTELNAIPLDNIVESELEERVQMIENHDRIKSIVQEISLGQQDEASPSSILETWNVKCSELSEFSPKFKEWSDRIYDIITELNDLTYEIDSFELEDNHSSSELDEIHGLLFDIEKLKRKHNVSSTDELIEIRDRLRQQHSEGESLQDRIDELLMKIESLEKELKKIGEKISAFRTKNAPKLSKKIEKALASLAMPNAKLIFNISSHHAFSESGLDKIDLLFSANKGFEPKSIKFAASGGEFARLSLVLQSILNIHNSGAVIVLDEIDTGVSGEVADKMGQMMKTMSVHNPIICISHLAQVVSKADKHFKVAKNHLAEKTSISITKLNKEERVKEVASLLSGENILESSLATAKDMIEG